MEGSLARYIRTRHSSPVDLWTLVRVSRGDGRIRAIFLPAESKNDPLSTGRSVSRVDLCFAILRYSFGRDVGFRCLKVVPRWEGKQWKLNRN